MLGLGLNLVKTRPPLVAAFSPTTVSGMAAWWAARKESFANNDPVGTATDWTGNGLSLTQTTASAKPTFVTNAKNGQPAFDLDGVDDYLDGGNILNIGTGSIHFFAVAAFDSAAGNQILFSKADYSNGTVPRYGASGITSGTWWNILTDTTPTTHQLTPGTADTSWHLFEYVLNRDTGVFSVILDGTQIASQAGIPAGNLTSTNVFVLGAWGEAQNFFANAKVAEVWCWQRVLTAGERDTLRIGAANLYNIPVYTSQFQPNQIAGLKLWLDASQIAGLNDGDAVATWSDVSGNGNNATQGTASQRPTFQTNEQNGRPVVLFDGVDDTLATAAFASAVSQPATIYTVVSRITTGTTYSDPVDGIVAGNRMVIAFENSTGNFAMFSGSTITFGGAVASGSGCQILTAIYNGASSLGFIDAVSQPGLAASSGAQSLTGVLLGDAPIGGQAFNGRIAELLIYAGAHDATNRNNVWTYLKAKWATP